MSLRRRFFSWTYRAGINSRVREQLASIAARKLAVR